MTTVVLLLYHWKGIKPPPPLKKKAVKISNMFQYFHFSPPVCPEHCAPWLFHTGAGAGSGRPELPVDPFVSDPTPISCGLAYTRSDAGVASLSQCRVGTAPYWFTAPAGQDVSSERDENNALSYADAISGSRLFVTGRWAEPDGVMGCLLSSLLRLISPGLVNTLQCLLTSEASSAFSTRV